MDVLETGGDVDAEVDALEREGEWEEGEDWQC